MGACVVMAKFHHVGGIKEMIAAGQNCVFASLFARLEREPEGWMCLALTC